MPAEGDTLDYIMFTNSYPPNIGGVERHVYEVHRHLNKKMRGKIVVFGMRPPADSEQPDVHWTDPRLRFCRFSKVKRLIRLFVLMTYLVRYPKAVIHFHDYSTIYRFLTFLRLYNVLNRTYLTYHGWEGVCPPDPKVIEKRKACGERVEGIISIGEFIPKWYGTPPGKISYGAADQSKFQMIHNFSNDSPIHIAYIGRFEKDNGVLELAAALSSFQTNENYNIKLSFYGQGSLQPQIRAFQESVKFPVSVHPQTSNPAEVFQKYSVIFASGYLTIAESFCAQRIIFAFYTNPLRKDYLRLHPAADSMFICGNQDEVAEGLKLCFDDRQAAIKKATPGWEWAAN